MARPCGAWPTAAGCAVVAAASATVGLIHAGTDSGRFVDDWFYAARARFDGPVAPRLEWLARPGQALIHTLQYALLGGSPLVQAVVLAAANAAAGAIGYLLLVRWFGRRRAVLAGLVFAALANHGSTSMWAATLPNVTALALAFAAGRTRRFPSALLAVTSILTYEGAAALAFAAFGLHLLGSDIRHRRRQLFLLCPPALALAYIGAASEKTAAHGSRLSLLTRVVATHFGIGIWPPHLVWLSLVAAASTTWAIATLLIPGFQFQTNGRLIITGLVLLLLGIAPFAVAGFPFATSGLLDRANIFSDPGLALIIAGTLLGAVDGLRKLDRRLAGIGWAVTVATVAILASGNVNDLRDARAATVDGRSIVQRTLSLGDGSPNPCVFAPRPPNRDGWSAFDDPSDLASALRFADPLHRVWIVRFGPMGTVGGVRC